ncbi:hypothetical protein J6590_071335 [Homalodisca vitripennis]|nr:hypothetical protein J6590_071335 [Homalodisca vitripennis]
MGRRLDFRVKRAKGSPSVYPPVRTESCAVRQVPQEGRVRHGGRHRSQPPNYPQLQFSSRNHGTGRKLGIVMRYSDEGGGRHATKSSHYVAVVGGSGVASSVHLSVVLRPD